MPKWILITLLVAAPLLLTPAMGGAGFFIGIALVLIANPIVWQLRKNRYFNSEQFQTLRAQIASLVAEHNEVVNYVAEIRSQGSFELGSSPTGQHAHLATFENTSNWNNRRDRNMAEYQPHVHNASLQVVRNASMEPIKYLMKYFDIKPDQATLADVQQVAEDIEFVGGSLEASSRAEQFTVSCDVLMSSGILSACISRRSRCPTRTTSLSTSLPVATVVRW